MTEHSNDPSGDWQSVEVSTNDNGRLTFAGPNLNKLMAQKQEPKADNSAAVAAARSGTKFVTRVGADGELHVTQHRAGGASMTPPTVAGTPTVVNALGVTVPLDRATSENEVATIPGMGDSSIGAWVQMGLMRRKAGGGFELVNPQGFNPLAQDAQQQKQEKAGEEKPVEKKQEQDDFQVDPALLAGVSTTEEADSAVASFERSKPGAYEATVAMAAADGDLDMGRLDMLTGMGSEESAKLGAALENHRAAGELVVSKMGADPLAFSTWLRARDPQAAQAVVRGMLKHDVKPLVRAVTAYTSERNKTIAAKATASGVDAQVIDGTVYFSRASLGLPAEAGRGDFRTTRISLADAVKAGLVIVNE